MDMRALLLAEIANRPGADEPRLIYADWLQQQGDSARADLIRVQCRLVQLDGFAPGRAELVERENELLAAHESRWREELPQHDQLRWGEFRRGFVESVRLGDPEQLAHLSAELSRAAPVVSLQVPSLAAEHVPLLLKSPWPARLQRLDLVGSRLGLTGAAQLAAGPAWPRLRELDLAGNLLGDVGLNRLLAWSAISQLELLRLSANDLTNSGVRALAEAGSLGRLRTLNLDGNKLTDTAVDILCRAHNLRSVTNLSLRGHHFSPGVRKQLQARFRHRVWC